VRELGIALFSFVSLSISNMFCSFFFFFSLFEERMFSVFLVLLLHYSGLFSDVGVV